MVTPQLPFLLVKWLALQLFLWEDLWNVVLPSRSNEGDEAQEDEDCEPISDNDESSPSTYSNLPLASYS